MALIAICPLLIRQKHAVVTSLELRISKLAKKLNLWFPKSYNIFCGINFFTNLCTFIISRYVIYAVDASLGVKPRNIAHILNTFFEKNMLTE